MPHTHNTHTTHPTSPPTPALLPSPGNRGPRRLRPGPVLPRTHRGAAAASPAPERELAEKLGSGKSGGTSVGRGRRSRRGRREGRRDPRGARIAREGAGRWRRRAASGGRRRSRLGCGGQSAQPGGSGAGGRSGRQASSGSGGAATLTSLGVEVSPLESPPWLARAGVCPRPRLRPAAPGLFSGPGGVARAPRPALDSRRRSVLGASSPGGNNGAGAGAPEAGRGEGSRPPPGVSRPCAPLFQTAAAASHAPCKPGSIAPRRPRRRGVPDCSTGTVRSVGRPELGPEKSPRVPRLFEQLRARGRGRRGRRNALRGFSVPSGRGPAAGTARVPPRAAAAPASQLPLTAARRRGRRACGQRSAPSAVRRRGARARPLTPTGAGPSSASAPCRCLLGLVVPQPRPQRRGSRPSGPSCPALCPSLPAACSPLALAPLHLSASQRAPECQALDIAAVWGGCGGQVKRRRSFEIVLGSVDFGVCAPWGMIFAF